MTLIVVRKGRAVLSYIYLPDYQYYFTGLRYIYQLCSQSKFL